MPLSTYAGPLAVTLAYILLYYGLVIRVGVVKTRLARSYHKKGERFDRYRSDDPELRAADRMQLNTLEQMPPFLALLWLTAVIVNPLNASVGGAIYLLARAIYPIALGLRLGRGVKAKVLISTVPGYLVIFYFVGRLVVALFGSITQPG